MYHNTDKQIQNASSVSSKPVKPYRVQYSTVPREARAARPVFALLKWEPDGKVGDEN
jgi:hypothetical protein